MVGDIHYQLPGVFDTLPTPRFVNAQLWTIPYELACYTAIVVLALLGIAKRPILVFAITFTGVLVITFLPQLRLCDLPPYGPLGGLLVFSFLFGASLYAMRRHVALSLSLFLMSALAYWVFVTNLNFIYLSTLPAAYITVFLGLQDPPKTLFIRGADYSYGIYLYGFPLQQTIVYLFPSFRIWYVNALSSVALALVSAYLSWTLVESRVLSHRKLGVSFASSLAERLKCAGTQYFRFCISVKRPLV